MISGLILIIITILLPPVGVAIIAGCGADLLINICLTILGYFPGHIHAFYLEYTYYKRRDEANAGVFDSSRAPGVYSDNVQTGGRGYGTMGGGVSQQPAGAPVPGNANGGAPPRYGQ